MEMKEEVRGDAVDESEENEQREVFAEVSLFGAEMAGSGENADCSCFSCDGNPCIK